MEEEEFNINLIERYILSPADIYWQKNSVSKIYISKKGDFLNLNLMKKFVENKKNLHLENSMDLIIHQDFLENFEKFNSEIIAKEKNNYRRKLVQLLLKHYYNSNRAQVELSLLACMIFSNGRQNDLQSFLDRDRDYFKWTLKIASSYTLCTFLMGYYKKDFLENMFWGTLENLNSLGGQELIANFILRIVELKNKTSLDNKDRDYIVSIVGENNFRKLLAFEKMDGTGVIGLKTKEFMDLEILFISLVYFFEIEEKEEEINILNEINNNKFNVNKKIMDLIKRNFEYEKEKEAVV